MKVYTPILWGAVPGVDYGADTIELARVVPRKGEYRRIYLDKYDRVKDGQTISCIWSPPFTDVNGWAEQPSEIASSYMVTGTAHLIFSEVAGQHIQSAQYFQDVLSHSLAVEIDVKSTRPLIDALALAEPDCGFRLPIFGTHRGGTMSLWLDSDGVNSANVAGYTYLVTRSHETLLEALVRITDEQVVLAYHHYGPPCEMECVILNNRLEGHERALFEYLIAIADPIDDSYKQYLV